MRTADGIDIARAGLRLVLCVLILSTSQDALRSFGAAFDARYGLVPSEELLREQVRDPFFAFVLAMTELDSLGTWSSADLMSFEAGWGRTSAFPLAGHIESLAREAIPDGEQQRLQGAMCDRRWVVRLKPPRVELPMPFSILGYRPGKLSVQGPLYLEEWRLGERQLDLILPDEVHSFDLRGLTVYRLASGWIIMDVHEWLDRLLGKLLEDAVMEGFIVARVAGELVGIGNSAGRRGRRLYGEIDFRTGRIETDGRPVVLAISRYCRSWTRPSGFDHRAVWKAYER